MPTRNGSGGNSLRSELVGKGYEEKSLRDVNPSDIKVGNRFEAYTSSAKDEKATFEITEGYGSFAKKEGEEGWDGYERVFYAKILDYKTLNGSIKEVRFEPYDIRNSLTKFYVKLKDDKPKDALTDIKAEIKEALKGGKFDFGQVTKRSRLIPKLESVMRGFTREKKNDEAAFISDQIARLRKKQG
jgi:hypothetical protein